MTRKIAYVSGPITHHRGEDPFAPATDALVELGYDVVNPKTIPKCQDESCEKLPHEQERGWKHSWACCLKHDLAFMLNACDTIVMLEGWQDSHGARLELTVASAARMTVLFARDLGIEP